MSATCIWVYVQAMARLWRVAHFVLNDFLDMPLPTASAAGHSVGSGHASSSWSQQQQHGRQRQSTASFGRPEAAGWLLCPDTNLNSLLHAHAGAAAQCLWHLNQMQVATVSASALQVHPRGRTTARRWPPATPAPGAAARAPAWPPRRSARQDAAAASTVKLTDLRLMPQRVHPPQSHEAVDSAT